MNTESKLAILQREAALAPDCWHALFIAEDFDAPAGIVSNDEVTIAYARLDGAIVLLGCFDGRCPDASWRRVPMPPGLDWRELVAKEALEY